MEEDRSAKFSPSKLDVYKNCPKRYQYRYVDRIARTRKTPETVLGVAVHAAFEELYELVRGGRAPAANEVRATFEKAFDEGWDESVKITDSRFRKDDWKKVGFDCVETYCKLHAPFTEDKTLAVEKRVGFPIEVEGNEYRIEGFIDRLSIAPDGAIVIHDYKTAKSLPDQAHADADWQLALYELAVRRDWPDVRDVRLQWHYVRHGAALTSVRDEAARERLRADAAALIARIKADHDFKTKRGPLCDWCEYRDLCPEFADSIRVAALPPAERGRDAGVRLVDALAALEAKRRRLRDELKGLDEEKKALDGRIADFSREAGVAVVAGTDAEAAVSFKEEVHLPAKTHEPERHAALEKEARSSPVWEDVARLDAHALADGVRARRWAGEALAAAEALLERYGRRETSVAVRLRRRRDDDEE
ncbi:MAG: PD-(D/E)XK nuclease family protein [Elusimicrobia bacterium]|nr:PD-(D/E)XK nuclease family protein [Elusimicrobiota bacterium]